MRRFDVICVYMGWTWPASDWHGIQAVANSARLCRAISSQLRHVSTIGEKLVKQQYVLHISPQYGELRPTSGRERLTSLGYPCKFQLVSRLGIWLCPPKFKWFTWLNHAPFRDALPSMGYQSLPTVYLPNLKSLSPLTITTKIWKTIQNVENGVVCGS